MPGIGSAAFGEVFGPAERALPATSASFSSPAAVDEFVAHSHAAGLSVALVATSIDNASEIAELSEPRALDLVSQQQQLQVHCMAGNAHLVHTTSTGGLLVVLADRDDVALSDRVAELSDRLRTPIEIDREPVWPLISMGARGWFPGEPLDFVARQTRAALTTARTGSHGFLHWCQPGLEDGAPSRLSLINDLAIAIGDGPQLRLHYQPLRDLGTGALVGAEALLRWQHPHRGEQPASSTVGTAERSGLIGKLGSKILQMSVAQLASWQRLVGPGFRMHVNVSPMELASPNYVDQVESLLVEYDVAPSLLLLEITETAAMTGASESVKSLHRLTDLGVGLGIDDFGTGYSSIAYLRDLPVDTVKVDRSLITGVATSLRDYTMASAVARLLSVMPVRILAEGVETAEQQTLLRAVGYHYGQGYHLGRPAPAEQLTQSLRTGTSGMTPQGLAPSWYASTSQPA